MSLYASTLNRTIACAFNGSDYIISSSAPGAFTCNALLRDPGASMPSQDSRSVTDILWSCLATVFACTWVSIHPNLPRPDATDWQIRRRRFLTMLCGLIAPELIVLWALRQWIGARFLVRKMEVKGVKQFTLVHGHFMQMGGFMLSSGGGIPLRVIEDYNELASCILEGGYILPTDDQIRDRSKGDALSKALVVGQTGWFVAQCISRWVLGLAITEIELVTVAFAALNGIIYFLWWHKPLDVRFAVSVLNNLQDDRLAENARPMTLPDDEDVDNYSSMNISARAPTPVASVGVDGQNEGSQEQSPNRSRSDGTEAGPASLPRPYTSYDTAQYSAGRVRIGDDLQILGRVVAHSRIGRLAAGLTSYAMDSTDRHLRISTLHSSCDPEDTFAATTLASGTGVLFGAVHCIAWNFQFLTRHEQLFWRIWSVIITATPFLLFIKSGMSYIILWRLLNASEIDNVYSTKVRSRLNLALIAIMRQIGGPSIWLTVLLAPVYVVARLGLLVQALVALRDLQPGQRAEVQWVNFLPHL